jgi:hypothetical protein
MRNLIFVLSILFFISCGSSTSSDTETVEGKENTEKSIPEKDDSGFDTGSCDEFLADYEEWVDEVIVILKKAKENPMDMQNTQKMMESTTKMGEWSQKWLALYDCANDEDYAKKMEELQEKVEKELGE